MPRSEGLRSCSRIAIRIALGIGTSALGMASSKDRWGHRWHHGSKSNGSLPLPLASASPLGLRLVSRMVQPALPLGLLVCVSMSMCPPIHSSIQASTLRFCSIDSCSRQLPTCPRRKKFVPEAPSDRDPPFVDGFDRICWKRVCSTIVMI